MTIPANRNATSVGMASPFPDSNFSKRPLGTAAWFRFPDGNKPVWRSGDLWLGRLPETGSPVGMRDDRHILVCAGPRSGKDASVVIPNLLMWAGSVVVIDPKGENAVVTARRRGQGSAYSKGMGQKVHILDPFDVVRTVDDDFADLKRRFNPVSLLRSDCESSVSKAALLADAIVVLQPTRQEFWEDTAQYCVQMLMLHVATSKGIRDRDRHLGTVRRLLVAGDSDTRKLATANAEPGQYVPSGMEILFDNMSGNQAFGGIIARAGERYANLLATSTRTLASTFETAATHTNFLDDPAMARCLTQSDFDLSELKDNPKGMSLYLSLPQGQMTAQYRLLRVMITLIVNEAQKNHVQPKSGHPVLMVLNEFAGLKRMQVVEDAIAQIAGYGVKMMMVVQTLPQIKKVYEDNWETFVGSSGTKIFFGNEDHFTREYVSKLIGDQEVTRRTVTFSATRGDSTTFGTSTGYSTSTTGSFSESRSSSRAAGSNGISFSTTVTEGWTHGASHTTGTSRSAGTNWSETHGWSETVHKRPLLTPDEVGRWFGHRDQPAAIVLMSGLQPLALARAQYFSDPAFAGRFDPHDAYAPPMTLIALAIHRAYEAQLQAEEEASKAQRRQAEADERQRIAQQVQEMRRIAKASMITNRLNDEINQKWHKIQMKRAETLANAIRILIFYVVLFFIGLIIYLKFNDTVFTYSFLTLIVLAFSTSFFWIELLISALRSGAPTPDRRI